MPPQLRVIEGTAPLPPDDDLMLAAAAGDRRAFSVLVERHEVSLRRFCRSITGDVSTARDAAQDAFLKLWAARERYRAQGRFKAYLYTLARNAARSMVRRRRVRSWLGLDAESIDPPQELLSQKQVNDLVSSALDRLPEKLRTPLVLRYVEELSYEEIALVIERTPSAARSRVFYALKELAALLPREVIE